MNEVNLLEIASVYELTTLVMGTASLIMGATLLTLRSAWASLGSRSKSGIAFLAIAMFALSMINFIEGIAGIDIQTERYSLSIVIFAASIEMFLLFTAYMSMLCKGFITRRRICLELCYIAIFTTPAMFVSPEGHPQLFDVLFLVGLLFYGVKLTCNYIEYRREIRKTRAEIENFHSDDSRLWVKWINNTFYVVIAIGVASVVAPMTNLTWLVYYNSFLVVAFLYIYVSFICNIPTFDKIMSLLEHNEIENQEIEDSDSECDADSLTSTDIAANSAEKQNSTHLRLIDEWIARRGYATAGITCGEVAKQLRTNRNQLSAYLNTELNVTYYYWITKLRMEDAKIQLREHPDRMVYEIALNVGIEDRDNFRHQFQRYEGVSPTAYRKKYNGWS